MKLIPRILFILAAFLLAIPSVFSLVHQANQQYSRDGDAIMDIVVRKPVVTKHDGINTFLNYSIVEMKKDQRWQLTLCPLVDINTLPVLQRTILSNFPVRALDDSLLEIPSMISLSATGCAAFNFSGYGKFQVGPNSTIIEINESKVTFSVTEHVTCVGRTCTAPIFLINTGNTTIQGNIRELNASVERARSIWLTTDYAFNETILEVNYTVNRITEEFNETFLPVMKQFSTTIRTTDTSVFVKAYRNVSGNIVQSFNHDVNPSYILYPGQSKVFTLHADLYESSSYPASHKHNDTITLFGNTYIIDPFFNSTSTNFDNGTYSRTRLNGSFIEINKSGPSVYFIEGNYTSEIFDANFTVFWKNISWDGTRFGELPNYKLNEQGTNSINMTGNVLLFHFDNDSSIGENDSRAFDWSGSGNNATLQNTTPATGKFGSTYNFTSGIANVSSSSTLNSLTTTFTVAAWIKIDDFGSDNMIYSSGSQANAYEIHLWNNINDKLTFTEIGIADYSANTAITDSNWHHVVIVKSSDSGTNMQFYLDGISDGSASVGSVNTPSGNKFIGRSAFDGRTFRGLIDEFSLWNRSLSSAEVLKIYKRGVLKFNISTRSCNDVLCSGESFIMLTNTTSPQNLNHTSNRYFQYRFSFSTNDTSYSPELYNVSIGYQESSVTRPSVIPTSPLNNTIIAPNSDFQIAANVTDDTGVSSVTASIIYPNSSVVTINLSNSSVNPVQWNSSYTTSLLGGTYQINYTAQDYDGNTNDSEYVFFVVPFFNFTIEDFGMEWIKVNWT